MEEKPSRRRVRIELTVNKHTITELDRLADLKGESRSRIVDRAIEHYGTHVHFPEEIT